MKLIPFVLKKKTNGPFEITRCAIFLSHAGKALWQTDESGNVSKQVIQEDYCEPNGFAVDNVWLDTKKSIAYIQVNPEKTSFADFYTWEEALVKSSKPECWRHFYCIEDQEGVDWWSPKGLVEAEFLPVGNIQDIIAEVRHLSKS